MKKLILIAGLCIALMGKVCAQDNLIDYRSKVTMGFKLGTNYSNVYDAQGEQFNADPKFGLAGGAFIGIPLATYIGLQPEILFSRKGFKATGMFLGSQYNLTRTTTYIDVPFYLTIKPIGALTLMVGPQYSYLIKQRDVFTSAFVNTDQEKEFENSNLRRNILSFSVGADVNLGHLVFGARAAADIMNNNGDGSSTTPRYKNMWYQFTIGYRLYAG